MRFYRIRYTWRFSRLRRANGPLRRRLRSLQAGASLACSRLLAATKVLCGVRPAAAMFNADYQRVANECAEMAAAGVVQWVGEQTMFPGFSHLETVELLYLESAVRNAVREGIGQYAGLDGRRRF